MEAAIVAGVGPGLGSSLARALAREGYAIGLFSRRSESSEPVAAQIRASGGRALLVPVDVTDREAVFPAVDRVRSELGAVSVLA
ncbi:MAG: SDR family NAD(P)-dependent oxidoreductase, partial [Candidatus Binatia bacterium]